MPAWLNAIGNALGNAAGGAVDPEYASKLRQMMENRRATYADYIGKMADQVNDPQTQGILREVHGGLASGKPMGALSQKAEKALQKYYADTQLLHQTFPPPGSNTPPSTPGPAGPGQVPGTTGQSAPANALQIPASAGTTQPFEQMMAQASGPPASAPAAQPSSNPISGAGPIQSPSPSMLQLPPGGSGASPAAGAGGPAAPGAFPLGTSAAAGPASGPGSSAQSPGTLPDLGNLGLPTAQPSRDLVERMLHNPDYRFMANRKPMETALQQELTHNEALRQVLETQQATLAYKQAALRKMKSSPMWETLPAITKAQYEAEAAGMSAAPMAATMMMPHIISPDMAGEDAPPGVVVTGTTQPPEKGKRYRVELYPLTGQLIATPLTPKTGLTDTTSGGKQITNLLTGEALGPAQGAVLPSLAAPHLLTSPSGGQFFGNALGNTGPVIPGAMNPQFVPQTSTLSVPGQLPQTTVRKKGSPAGSAGSGSPGGPAAGTSGLSVPPGTSPPDLTRTLEGRKYQDWANGGPAPTGKELTAVQEFARRNGLESPLQLSAKGQGDLAAIEPVIQEIQDIKKKLEAEKLSNSDSRELVPDFLRYSHGLGSTPHDDLFTSLSFEQLRSAAAAMKGMNSRAYPILNRALQHTPTLDRAFGLLPDTPKTMYDKLSTMETILTQGRDAIIKDERKSGVISGGATQTNPSLLAPMPVADPLGIR